jgi:rare lipoprotein A
MMYSIENRAILPRTAWLAAFAIALIAGAGISSWKSRPIPAASVQAPPTTLCRQGPTQPALDCSGLSRFGIASFYAARFGGRTMADGTPMRLYGDNAASRTLPLGTTARVINLTTRQSALIRIRDRGPYVGGRIVDLSPATARKIGISRRQGLARVEVAPISVPLPDGTIKRGVAAPQRFE